MKKQFLAVLLTMAMLLSILPASALAAEGNEDGGAPVVYTETGEDPEGDPTDIPGEPDKGPVEGVSDPTVTGPEQEEPAEEPTAVEQLQARINDLPDADALAGMDKDEQAEVYAEVCAISDAIDELTTEEADALDTAKLEATAAFFTQQIMPLEGEEDTPNSCGDNVTWTFNEGSGTLTISGTGAMADYTENSAAPWSDQRESITKVVVESGVTSIGAYAFDQLTAMDNISMPDSIVSIGTGAFRNCETLSTLAIGSSVAEIDAWALNGLDSLVSYTVAEGNTTFLAQDGVLFKKTTDGLTLWSAPKATTGSYTVPASINNSEVNKIGDAAFIGSSYSSVSTGENVTEIGGYAFTGCDGLTSVTFGNGLEKIGEYGFGRTAISNISFPDSLTELGQAAFFNCTSLTSVNTNKIQTIGGQAFQNCSSISNIVFGTDVTLSANAFAYDTALEELTITTGVTVNGNAFLGCTGLKSLTVNSGATINSSAFSGCAGLTSLKWNASTLNDFIFRKSSLQTVEISDNVTIASHAFRESKNLETVKLGTECTVGEMAFYSCTGMKTVEVGDSSSLGASAFKDCSGLETVTLGNSCTIGNYAFMGCSGLKTLSFGNNTTIAQGTFKNLANLQSLTIGDSSTIGTNAFEGCAQLSTLNMGKGCTLNTNAFMNCTSLETLTIPAKTTFAGSVFNRCTSLKAVTFSDTVTPGTESGDQIKVVRNAFNGCSNIEKFIFKNGTSSAYQPNANHIELMLWDAAAITPWYKSDGTSYGRSTATDLSGEVTLYVVRGIYSSDTQTISLDANGGTAGDSATTNINYYYALGLDDSASINITGKTWALPTEGYTRNGYELAGWNTKADGTGTSYSSGTNYSVINQKVDTLYAQWTKKIGTNTNYTVNAIVDQTYTGEEIKPTVVVKEAGGYELNANAYTVTYSGDLTNVTSDSADSEKIPTVKVTLKDSDNSATVTFKIIKDENPSVSMADVSVTYDGNAHAVTATAKTSAGNEITGENIITIKYYTDENCSGDGDTSAPTNAGTYYAKATLTGTDNYAEATKTAKIEISNATFRVAATGFDGTYDGKAHSITVKPEDTDVTVFYCETENGDYTSTNPTYTNVGEYTVYYKATKDNHDDATGSVSVKITKATLTATYVSETINVGGTPKLEVTVAGFVNGEKADDAADYKAPTVTNSNTAVGNYELKPAGGSAKNYQFAYVAGTLTIRSSGNGGGGGSSSGGSTTYTVTVDSTKNGTVTVSPKNASKGATVTITVKPNSGYEVDDLTVTDKNGDTVRVKDQGNGKYTFTMPASKVTVEASFTKIEEQPSVTFADVPTSAYYYDAVAWAVENGVTSGTTATTFSPNAACTRAQTVTFLWRAAGSPAPKSSANPFTDVQPGAYYYDAVLWAVEQGITTGTTATTFSPNATVTRGQTVTFLHRATGTAVAGSNPFTDVADSAYYAGAVKWAVAEGITSGTSATTFSPNQVCTRAQIVTFLYRAYA